MLDIIILLAIGFFVGWKASEIIHVLSFRRIMRDLGINDDRLRQFARDQGLEVPEPKVSEEDQAQGIRETMHIRIEQHQGQIYAFRVDTEQFLGQGSDRDDLVRRIAERFRGVRMIIDEGADLLQKNNG